MVKFHKMSKAGIALILVCCASTVFCAGLPLNFFIKCTPSDDDCLQGAVEDAFNKLGNGIEDLKMSGLDPLVINTVIIDPVPGPLHLYQNYTNMKLYKISQTNIKKYTIDLEKCNMRLETFTSAVEVHSHYILKGKFLLFTIDGEGELLANQNDFTTTNDVTCEKFTKDGKEFLKITKVTSKVSFGKLVLHMGELLKGNAEISKEINNALNKDSDAFHGTIKVALEQTMQEVLKTIGNQLFTQVPIKEIFDI